LLFLPSATDNGDCDNFAFGNSPELINGWARGRIASSARFSAVRKIGVGLMPDFPKRYADAVAKLRVPQRLRPGAVFAWFPAPHLIRSSWARVRVVGLRPAGLGIASRNIGLGTSL